MKKSTLLATLSVCGVALATLALLSKGSFIAVSARTDGPERTIEFVKGDLTNVQKFDDYGCYEYSLSHLNDTETYTLSNEPCEQESGWDGSYIYSPDNNAFSLPGESDNYLISFVSRGSGQAPYIQLDIAIYEGALLNTAKSGFVYSSSNGEDHVLQTYATSSGEKRDGKDYTIYRFMVNFYNEQVGQTLTIHEFKLVYNC